MRPQSQLDTALAAEQINRLKPTLRRFDIVFLTVAAVVSIEVIAQISSYGGETFTWALVLAVTFLLPYALIFAEVGSTFTDEGGPYVWVKLAFGRAVAAVSTLFYWVTTPVWIGGSMAFLAAETWNVFLSPITHGGVVDYLFKLAFIWTTVLSAVVSLQKGKWLPTASAIAKIGLLSFFLLTTLLYAVKNGVHGIGFGDLSPTLVGFLGLTPLLLFAYLGFEAGNGAAGEMKNARRDVPISLARSAAIAATSYLLPILAMLIVLPTDTITGVGGLMDAMATVFAVYGPAGDALLKLAAIVLIFVLIGQGGAWMIVSDRVQGTAAADGAFFGGFFGVFHEGLGTPIRVNVLSGVVASAFMVAAMRLVEGEAAAVFTVVLVICISTYLLSYLAIIPAAARLRRVLPDVDRPFRVPVSDGVFKLLVAMCTAWIALGSWVAVFPGTLERLFGVAYPFEEYWGVTRTTFQTFTLCTLGLLAVLAVAGYRAGRKVRSGAVGGGVAEPSPTAASSVDLLRD